MEPRSARKRRIKKGDAPSHLSPAVAGENNWRSDKGVSPLWDALANLLLFMLGGVILCAMLYALLSFT